jgi:hypothetical protein
MVPADGAFFLFRYRWHWKRMYGVGYRCCSAIAGRKTAVLWADVCYRHLWKVCDAAFTSCFLLL